MTKAIISIYLPDEEDFYLGSIRKFEKFYESCTVFIFQHADKTPEIIN